ncbi:MAG TPA: DUF559 domain-containing protein [Lysobacter sp.]|nr:DUF559 domain-containing protein [Lysobacter sp.]
MAVSIWSKRNTMQRAPLGLSSLGYRVLRYWNDDVLLRLESVVDDIYRQLMSRVVDLQVKSNIKSTPPQPSPSLRERRESNS